MSDRVNMLEHWSEESSAGGAELRQVRLDANEVVVVPFTTEGNTIRIHYCEETEISGYVRCNGEGCILCRAGKKVDERVLLPVYQPATLSIGVLAISPVCRPGALRPQVMNALRSGKRLALLIRKPDKVTHSVVVRELEDGMDDGAEVIAAFLKRWEAGEVALTSVFPRIDDRDLEEIPSIATMLRFKGVHLGAAH